MNTIDFVIQFTTLLTVIISVIKWFINNSQNEKRYSLITEFSAAIPNNSFAGTFGQLVVFSAALIVILALLSLSKDRVKIVVNVIMSASLASYMIHTFWMLFVKKKVTSLSLALYSVLSTVYVHLIFSALWISIFLDIATTDEIVKILGVDTRVILGIIVFVFTLTLLYFYLKGVNDIMLYLSRSLNYFIVYYGNSDEKIICNDIKKYTDRYLLEIDGYSPKHKRPVITNIITLNKEDVKIIEYIKTLH